MWFGLITLFPEMFQPLTYGITGRALKNKLIETHFFNPRDFSKNKHRTVDDKPYGGGPGMVMGAEPLLDALSAAKQQAPCTPYVIYLSPQGAPLKQAMTKFLQNMPAVILLCGRYEGIDERILCEIDAEWSIGDYVLSGGEIPALVVIDAVTRLLPDALGDATSSALDSLENGLLKYPQYTRPASFRGASVPTVLMNGNHAEIVRWRLKQSLGQTWKKRPDLLQKRGVNAEERALLDEYIAETAQDKPK
ncbi:MAG: tRNA (guanosine(37)-N1)-methyltransferase TrmD [Gammaproteobacteria bacterium]|nr:tRNA (guanosine(37)-N1)-methyltransferase TrmD [Gammaproteobacteria bacterium]